MHRKTARLFVALTMAAGCVGPVIAHAQEKVADPLAAARRTCFEVPTHEGPGAPGAVLEACNEVIGAMEPDRAKQAQAYYRRGIARQHYGQFYEAQLDWSKAVAIDHTHVPARLMTARWALLSNRYDIALATYKEAARLDPENAQAHHGMGMALRRMGRLDEAFEALEKALELDRTLWRSLVEIAKIHEQRDDFDAALEAYAEASQRVDGATDWHFMQIWSAPEAQRARLLHRLGRTREAISDLTRALERDPRRYDDRKMRAELHVHLLEYDAAIADYTVLAEEMPAHLKADPLFARARIHQKLGDADAAYQDMQEVMRVGGTQATLRLQVFLKNKGYGDVAIDGKDSENMRRALKDCVRTPACVHAITAPI